MDRLATIATGSAECLAYASETGANCPMEDGWQDVETGECNWDCRDYCPLVAACDEPRFVEIVQLASHDPALLRDETSRDCRSHYDPAYDVLVFGEVDSPPCATSFVLPQVAASPTSVPIDWSDYASLLDEAIAARSSSPVSAESTNTVRSGHQLLDFAAAALKNAGMLLQSMGEQLHNAAVLTAEDHVAGQPEASQR
jgi:hypothetical protein